MNILASDSIHTEEITLGEDGMPISAMQRREGQQHRQPTPAEVLRWLPKGRHARTAGLCNTGKHQAVGDNVERAARHAAPAGTAKGTVLARREHAEVLP